MKPDPTLEAEAIRNAVIQIAVLRLIGEFKLIFEMGGLEPVLAGISTGLRHLAADRRADARAIRDAQAAILRAQEDAGASI